MFDSDYVKAWDLLGKDRTVTISRVVGSIITGEKGRKSKKPILYFEGKEKGFIANVTNCKIIEKMYGSDPAEWVGKKVTLWPTTTEDKDGVTVETIRVRPKVTKGAETIPEESATPPMMPTSEFAVDDYPLGDVLDDPKGDPS